MIITAHMCNSNEPYHTMLVESTTSRGVLYTILVPFPTDAPEDWICSCPSWKYRGGRCKHTAIVSPCHWEELVGPEIQTPEQKQNMICPRCFGPTYTELQADD